MRSTCCAAIIRVVERSLPNQPGRSEGVPPLGRKERRTGRPKRPRDKNCVAMNLFSRARYSEGMLT